MNRFLLLLVLLNISFSELVSKNITSADKKLTVLFTGDMHSAADKYPQLSTLLKREKKIAVENGSAVITVSSGDDVMGTLFHTLFNTSKSDYTALSLMDYDVSILGNHDFDFGLKQLAMSLNSYGRRQKMAFLSSNTFFDTTTVWKRDAYNAPEINKYLILDCVQSDGSRIKVGIIGLLGDNALDCISDNNFVQYSNRIECALHYKEVLERSKPDFTIILSHGGTTALTPAKSEDGKLAKAMSGVDAIISGHDHVALGKPLFVNDIPIVSSGSSLSYLGKLTIEKTSNEERVEYQLIPVSDTIMPDNNLLDWVDRCKVYIDTLFKNRYNISVFDTIKYLPRSYSSKISDHDISQLGCIVAESYVNAVNSVRHYSDLISVVPLGMIRDSLRQGALTYESLFKVMPLGSNGDDLCGYPLVLVWALGKDIYDLCELNASVSSKSSDMRLFFGGGLKYTYNPYRLPLTRVKLLYLNGRKIDRNRLYPIVTDIYTAKLLGLVKSSSFGLLSVRALDENGREITDFNTQIIEGLTAWKALGYYLDSNTPRDFASNSIRDKNRGVLFLYLLILVILICPVFFLVRRKIKSRR